MAEGTRLTLTFDTSEGKTASVTFNYAKPSATTAQVKTLMQAMITNTDVFASTFTAAKSAKLTTTTESTYDLSNEAALNSGPIPTYEALKRGLITEEEAGASLDDYNEDGTLKIRNDGSQQPFEVVVK